MSTVTLVTIEGFGSQGVPRVPGTQQYVDISTTVPDDRDIAAVMRREFDPEPDGSRRSNPSLDPVIRYERINELVGKLLTFADASTADTAQRKAQKDLIKQTVWEWYEAQTAGLRSERSIG
jgi:hypothetical protein